MLGFIAPIHHSYRALACRGGGLGSESVLRALPWERLTSAPSARPVIRPLRGMARF